jgi:phosphohistidine phosphatase
VSWLVAGADDSFLDLKKGGACLLELDGKPGPGSATLRWLMAPKHLRALA